MLYVASVNDPEMTHLATTLAKRVSQPMERTFVTRTVAPRQHADLHRSTVARVSGWWVASGFLVAVAWALVRRLRRRSPGLDVRSSVLLGVACGALSLATAALMAASHGDFVAWWLLGFVTTYAAAAATRALEVLFGLVGLALASTLFLFLAGPLLSGRDPRLLPGRWWEVAPWTLHGATNELTTSYFWFGTAGLLRPVLVLVGTVVIALIVVVVGPRLRDQSADEHQTARVPWRLRTVVILVPVVLAIVAATALAPSVASVVTADPVPGASETECVATPKISSVADLNEFAGKVRGGSAFQGADVGADVLLQDGRRLWVFGDTLRAPDFAGQQFVRNSMLVFGGGCADAVAAGRQGRADPRPG